MKAKKSLWREDTRVDLYKLLSECYYPPDEKLIKKLSGLDGSISGPCSEIVKYVPAVNELEPLGVDFSRLFLGPFKLLAPPYGSLYLEGSRTVMSNSTIDVRNRYRHEKLDISLKEVPDHIAIELEFMYFLAFKEKETIKNSDFRGAADYLKKQISFLEIHLGRWIPAFADNVVSNAQTEFYKNLAEATESFIKEDLEYLLDR